MSSPIERPTTSVETIPETVKLLRTTYSTGVTHSYEWRIEQLKTLRRLLKDGRERLSIAMWKDLHRSRFETKLLELMTVESDLDATIESLSSWMKPERVSTNLVNIPGSSYIQNDPLGVALIMAPWNYPIQLIFSPLVGCLAAGNCVLLRPAQYTPNVAATIAELVEEYFNPEYVTVVTGERQVTTATLQERFDIIFFTGGTTLGKVVHAAANKHLTPTILELGGKSPCYVHKDADIDVTARRITWAAFTNAGQTCVRPDYLLVHRSIAERLIPRIKHYISKLYTSKCVDAVEYGYTASSTTSAVESFLYVTEDAEKNTTLELDMETLKNSPYFGRLVNGGGAFERITKILEQDKDFISFGGAVDRATNFIAPSLIDFKTNKDAFNASAAMQEEIFGPILPIYYVEDEEEAISYIHSLEKPLALYCFTNSSNIKNSIAKRTTSGSLVFNDAIIQLSNHSLPFGGVGASGMGSYHGKFSFHAFSHRKSILYKTSYLDLDARYAPYSSTKEKVLGFVGAHIPKSYYYIGAGVLLATTITAVALGTKKYW